jgi:hypothetical protein
MPQTIWPFDTHTHAPNQSAASKKGPTISETF